MTDSIHQTFSSIDAHLAAMRAQFEAEKKTLQDQLFIAQAEVHLIRDQLDRAIEARSTAERITAKLLTQFGTVALIFEEARSLAQSAGWLPALRAPGHTDLMVSPESLDAYLKEHPQGEDLDRLAEIGEGK